MAKKSTASTALKAKPAKVKSSPPTSKRDFDADDLPMKGNKMPSNMGQGRDRGRGRGSLGGDY